MKSSVNYRDNYGASELKSYYGRNLAIGLLISLTLHGLVIGYQLLNEDDVNSHPPVRLAPLDRPPIDTLFTLTVAPPAKKPGHEGGGSPEEKLPPGRASKGHPDARPDKTHNQPDKSRTAVPKVADKMRPVEKEPERPRVAGDTRDTSKPTAVVGTKGQNLKGTGDKPAGGIGGVGIGFATGFGSRGWDVAPRAKYPEGTGATGKVTLRFTVLPNGNITNIAPVKRTNEALVNAAMAGLRRARARPLSADDPQVPQQATISFTFELR